MNPTSLVRDRRFLPLFGAQLAAAFAGNLFKSAAVVLLIFGGGPHRPASGALADLYGNLASAAFILPFVLFSLLAGRLADSYDKAALLRWAQCADVVIAIAALAALASGNGLALLVVLFAFGSQAAFFGPAKFAILPQQLRAEELIAANAWLETSTFLAILLGTVAGGVLAAFAAPVWAVGLPLLGVTVVGLLAAWAIPPAPPSAAASVAAAAAERAARPRGIVSRYVADLREVIALASARRSVLLAILGISWFWLVGSAYIAQAPRYVQLHLGARSDVVTLLLACFALGIGVGSWLCERLSGETIEPGIVPLGSTGISLFALDAYFQTFDSYGASPDWLAFLFSMDGSRLCLDFVGMGACGALFVVPLQAMIQHRTPAHARARILAVNNIVNAVFMALAAVFAALMLVVAELPIDELLMVFAVMNLAVAWFIYHQVPEFTARLLIWLLTHTMYRVRHDGLAHIPAQGAAVLVCNHVSFVDALLLAGAVRRPIRFVMYKPIYDLPVLNFVFRAGGAIPIAGRNEDPAALDAAFATIRDALRDGELVGVFPEGKLTRDGEIDVFRPGVERIIAETPVPVVPLALRGLWGSWFSPEGGGAFAKRPKRFWSRVEVVAGPRVAPDQAHAAHLRELVLGLRGAHA